jgi:hypothetical protein
LQLCARNKLEQRFAPAAAATVLELDNKWGNDNNNRSNNDNNNVENNNHNIRDQEDDNASWNSILYS